MIPETELAREDQSAPPLRERIEEIVKHRLGAPAAGLLLSPAPQLPVGVLTVGPAQAAVSTARFRVYPGVGWERCARLGVLAAASGAAATGLPLQCLAVSLSVPPSTTEKNLTDFWRRVHREATKLGVGVAANTTVVDPFGSLPDAGVCTALAMGEGVPFVTAGTALPGDLLVMTQSAGIEAAALIALVCEEDIAENLGEGFAEDAAQMYRSLSTMMECGAARRAGIGPQGITAMHNAGAAGVLTGIQTMARASGLGFEFDRGQMLLTDEVDAILTHAEIDPLVTASQGVLLLTCRPSAESRLRYELDQTGVGCAVFGRVSDEFEGVRALNEGRALDVDGLTDRRLPHILAGALREQH
jgi:hydrogenase maturation factor